MDWTTAEGKSYEEAVGALLKSLGADKSEVEIENLGESKKLFGFGGTVIRVRGRLKEDSFDAHRSEASAARGRESAPEAPARAAEPVNMDELGDMPEKVQGFLADMLRNMGIGNATIDIVPGDGQVVLNIISADGGTVIGRNGETLEALQTLVEIYAGRLNGAKFPFVIDTESYRSRREKKLQALAEKSATRAVKTGRQVFLGPMKPSERKAIHTFLQDHPEVKTRSQGSGDGRQVVVFPSK